MGQLAHAFNGAKPSGTTILALSRRDCDITDSSSVTSAVRNWNPDVVVNLAGYTAVDLAETNREAAFAVNAQGAGNLARAATLVGARTIYVSTDYVFDGRRRIPYPPDAHPNPLNVYGESKLAGEREVQSEAKDALILRSGWVYSTYGNNFFLRILELARERSQLRVVNDQRGTPTSADELARVLWLCIMRTHLSGIHHFANAGEASWYEFTCEILSLASSLGLLLNMPDIVPIKSEDYNAAAQRPTYSVLDAGTLSDILNHRPSPWQAALRTVMKQYTGMRSPAA